MKVTLQNCRSLVSLCVLWSCMVFASGCPGLADYSYPVAGNYEVIRFSAHQIEVVPRSGGWSSAEIIPAKVVEVAWDDRFVLAKQQVLAPKYPGDPNRTYEEPVPGEFFYWILDVDEPEIYGPLTQSELRKKRSELQVNPDLALRPVDDYR